MTKITPIIAASIAVLGMFAAFAEAQRVQLWPDGAMPAPQQKMDEAPFLEWRIPENQTSDACVIVIPGGGYMQTSVEGTAATTAADFNARGVAAAILRYRTPRPAKPLAKHVTAWQDAQRAIRIVKSEAPSRGINPERVGMIGFSAGGHLTLMCATSSSTNAYARIDNIDDISPSLAFAIPVYPAYVLWDGANSKNSRKGNDAEMVNDFLFDSATPPMCLVHGDADVYSAMGSVKVYHQLRKLNIPAELHIYAHIKHAFGGSDKKIAEPKLWRDEVWNWLAPQIAK